MKHHFGEKSSSIHSLDHNEGEKKLTLNFHSGSSYEYAGVQKEVAEKLKASESPGTFFHQFIRGRYQERKL